VSWKLEAKDAEMAARELELKEKAEALKKSEEEEQEKALNKAEVTEANMSIEEQIALFEQDLAVPCPICSIGKIVTSVTDKQKEYYSCTNEACKFISWSKPYHYECPLCKTPYLIEVTDASGLPGLKCPRAACSFSQSGTQSPAAIITAPPSADPAAAPKKKKKIVRRKKK
jgi:hypothetical protein